MGKPLRVRIGFLHRRRELELELPAGTVLVHPDGTRESCGGHLAIHLLENKPAPGRTLLKLLESPRREWLEQVADRLRAEGRNCITRAFAPGFTAETIAVQPSWLLAAEAGPDQGPALRAQVADLLGPAHGPHEPHGPAPASPGPLQTGDLAHLGEDARIFLPDGPAQARARLSLAGLPDRELDPRGLRVVLPEGRTASVAEVEVGIDFHWQHRRTLDYPDTLEVFVDHQGLLGLLNELPLEDYLRSVNSSEMTADCPLELLKAQTIAARSTWLATRGRHHHGEAFDICADDHCQCYRGSVTIADSSRQAVDGTLGQVLCHGGRVLDARYSKSCGGIVEAYENVWENTPVPGMTTLCDTPAKGEPPRRTEEQWRAWILAEEDVWCNTERWQVPQMLGYSDGYYRWTVTLDRAQAADLLRRRAGLDFDTLIDLVPGPRGRSGRLISLQVHTDRGVFTIGKELKIRRALSESHLYSAAIFFDWQGDTLTIHGKGWGHGVGMCQLGAARMALEGLGAEAILAHYYPGSELRRLS